jgi:hypothetical protein
MLWLSQQPNLSSGGNSITDEIIKVSFRMTLYAIFFVLVYRSFILTLKNTVSRLAKWRSKREQEEDHEFVFIIETLIVILTIFITISFSFVEEISQIGVQGRNHSNFGTVECSILNTDTGTIKNEECIVISSFNEANKDILVSIMSVLLTAIVVYAIPVIGEFEVALNNKLVSGIDKFRKRKKIS